MTLREYLSKMRGSTRGSPPRVSNGEILWSWIGAVLGMGLLAWVHRLLFVGTDMTLMIGSFGASAVLVYGATRSPLAQPRNLVGGHVVSALVGVTTWKPHPDAASAGRSDGLDRGDRLRPDPRPGVPLCSRPGHGRPGATARGWAIGQQHSSVPALPGDLVLAGLRLVSVKMRRRRS